MFTAVRRHPRPRGPPKLTIASGPGTCQQSTRVAGTLREALVLERWRRSRRGVLLTGSVPRRAGDAAPVTECGASASRASVYGDADQSDAAR